MEQANFIQDYTALAESAMMGATVYLSVLSAYLFVAYSVGEKLTLSQNLLISTLFVVFSSVFSFATYGLMEAAGRVYASEFGTNGLLIRWGVIIGLCQVAGILGSLVFMYNIRNGSQK